MAQIAMLAIMAVSALNKGAQERKVKYQEAEGIRDARNRHMAATTAAISEREREKKRMYSRALAVSASSGAGVDDPGMVAIIGDLNAEGEYRILSQLYVGSSEAEGLRHQSEMARVEGEAALEASYMKAATTVMSAYGSYGSMFAAAGSQISSFKNFAYNKLPHGIRAGKSNLGTMDYTTSGVAYG